MWRRGGCVPVRQPARFLSAHLAGQLRVLAPSLVLLAVPGTSTCALPALRRPVAELVSSVHGRPGEPKGRPQWAWVGLKLCPNRERPFQTFGVFKRNPILTGCPPSRFSEESIVNLLGQPHSSRNVLNTARERMLHVLKRDVPSKHLPKHLVALTFLDCALMLMVV